MLSKNRKKILFIAHEASYTGAPVLLLNLLKLLKKDAGVKTSLIIARGGPLEKAFAETTTSIILKAEGYSQLKKNLKWTGYFLRNKINIVKAMYLAMQSDIIFSNSVVNVKLIRLLSFSRKPVAVYVHELEKVMERYTKGKDGAHLLNNAAVFLYPGEAVKNILKKNYAIAEQKLKPLRYYIPFENTAGTTQHKTEVKKETFITGAAGNASLRKGTDLFIEVAKLVCEKTANINFVWAGGFETPELEQEWRQKVILYGLQDRFVFTGPRPPEEMKAVYPEFDILFLSSREDPYPLVVLEAAYCMLPSVIFSGSGGITEFVKDDAGWAVDDFSLTAAAATIIQISNDPRAILQKAETGRKRVELWHTDGEKILKQFYHAIDNL